MTTPARLGKYEITEVLGTGAIGVVYRGFDPGIRRVVAIKTIRRELISGDRPGAMMLKRFRNEAQAAGKLAHRLRDLPYRAGAAVDRRSPIAARAGSATTRFSGGRSRSGPRTQSPSPRTQGAGGCSALRLAMHDPRL